jgi:hypothetical protein
MDDTVRVARQRNPKSETGSTREPLLLKQTVREHKKLLVSKRQEEKIDDGR